MLVEKVIKFYNAKYDYNCSECIMVAASEEYYLNISKDAIKAMASFGGGMGIESICGAATGAIAVIGIMFTNERGHESPIVKELTIEFMDKFRKRLDSLDCVRLKELYRTDDERCIKMMVLAAEVLDEIVLKNK